MRLLDAPLIPALALLFVFPANAQTTYPDRPIKMIVPLAAASAVDVAARIVTQKMADNMGQQFVILNQPGASGLIGAEQVARAEPDGYTIGGFNDSIMTMVPNLQSKMRWDILKDFDNFPVCPPVWEPVRPGFFLNSGFGIRARAGTPKDIIAKLNAKVGRGVGDPEPRRKLEELGFAVRGSSAAELAAMTRDQLAKYARVMKEMGIAQE